MSYQTSPAVQRHFLDSILPYQIKTYQMKQFPKSKQFYRPQQFIWNNPHRTSSSIYKFYHKYNKQYQTKKQPIIKKIEYEDKKQQQLTRIRRLSEVKLQTKRRFFNRKHERQNLQYLSGTRLPITSQNQFINSAVKRFSTISHYHSKPTKYQTMIPQHISKLKNANKKSQTTNNIESSYLTGVGQFALKKKLIEKLIIQQTHREQEKLKSQFQKQKQANSKKLSRISKIGSSKVQKSFSMKD